MKTLLSVLLCAAMVGAFCAGRYIGHIEGPRIVHNYIEPPVDWRFGYRMGEPGIYIIVERNSEPKSEIRTPAFHDCVQVSEEGNFAGYMSEATIYQCREGKLRIEGKWGEDIQSGWSYRTKYGSLDGYGQFIGDEPLEMQMPKYQKWCKTKYGFTLCGWNDEEHNKEMERMKQDSKHPRPYQK